MVRRLRVACQPIPQESPTTSHGHVAASDELVHVSAHCGIRHVQFAHQDGHRDGVSACETAQNLHAAHAGESRGSIKHGAFWGRSRRRGARPAAWPSSTARRDTTQGVAEPCYHLSAQGVVAVWGTRRAVAVGPRSAAQDESGRSKPRQVGRNQVARKLQIARKLGRCGLLAPEQARDDPESSVARDSAEHANDEFIHRLSPIRRTYGVEQLRNYAPPLPPVSSATAPHRPVPRSPGHLPSSTCLPPPRPTSVGARPPPENPDDSRPPLPATTESIRRSYGVEQLRNYAPPLPPVSSATAPYKPVPRSPGHLPSSRCLPPPRPTLLGARPPSGNPGHSRPPLPATTESIRKSYGVEQLRNYAPPPPPVSSGTARHKSLPRPRPQLPHDAGSPILMG